MGIFSKKTKYAVSSSTSPFFDPEKRINQFEAAMLDYTQNARIEQFEYMKNYYDSSRLRGHKQFINWWRNQGNEEVFGKVSSTFFTDAKFDVVAIADAIKNLVDLKEGDVFTVYEAVLNNFSEDFYVRYLATLQGHADWFQNESDADYTIDYPNDDDYFVVNFVNGNTLSGTLPEFDITTRFLEIKYSILRSSEEIEEKPPVVDENGEIIEPGQTITVTTYEYIYGYYQYKEGSGNSALDAIIENNGIEAEYTFYPPIPLRTNTSWYSGDKAARIENALHFLEYYGLENQFDIYSSIQKELTEGIKDGDIGDIDYITLLFGVSINSNHFADCKYLYEFFYNLHFNEALADGSSASIAARPIDLTIGNFSYHNWYDAVLQEFSQYKTIHINCASSNLNIYIKWIASDYFETNGQFKPDAKKGDYGVLCNRMEHKYQVTEPARDDEGNIIIRHDEDGSHVVYEVNTYTAEFDMVLFCHQFTDTRWRFICFLDPYLNNLVYHGKSVNTFAWDAFSECTELGTVTHTFHEDIPSAPGEYYTYTLKYIKIRGNPTSAFIIPMEWNTFMECGIVTQTELTYGDAYLVFNCWVKYKTGGFGGILGAILGVISIVVGVVLNAFSFGTAGNFFIGAGIGMLVVSAIMIFTPIVVSITSMLFGEAMGNLVYRATNIFLQVLIQVMVKICPPIGIGMAFAYQFNTAISNGESFGSAFGKGLLAGAAAYASKVAGKYVQTTTGSEFFGNVTSGFISGTSNAYLEGSSIGDAVVSGLISGVASGAVQEIAKLFPELSKLVNNVSDSIEDQALSFQTALTTAIKDTGTQLLTNPNTYVNLLGAAQEEIFQHKLENLSNDYEEFNNKLKTATESLYIVQNLITSTVTAEFVCKLQSNIGRVLTNFPDIGASLSVDNFMTLSLSSGSDFCDAILSSPSNFVENKLTMTGYTPETLYYNQINFGLSS